MSERFNGWANYNTWTLLNWLSHDERWNSEAAKVVKSAGSKEEAVKALGDYVEEHLLPNCPGAVDDLIASALREVDWEELVKWYKS